jgi:putative sterol carrier protein
MDAGLEDIRSHLEEAFHPERAKGTQARIQIELEEGGAYFLIIKDETMTSGQGKIDNPRLTLQASLADLLAIFSGKLDPTSAFFQGKLHLRGDMNLAMKVVDFFKK